eukprot:TRINITY_DN1893_c0_g1_i1.p1 TRINITY_DN1893_c0_g1~~TRINITY_DN1893_c0_g1_i1.p1  ORF type:complete len:135 (-),score=6.79 TRINITY_DN1893_c0_g1_i1:306-710(-)
MFLAKENSSPILLQLTLLFDNAHASRAQFVPQFITTLLHPIQHWSIQYLPISSHNRSMQHYNNLNVSGSRAHPGSVGIVAEGSHKYVFAKSLICVTTIGSIGPDATSVGLRYRLPSDPVKSSVSTNENIHINHT